MGQPRYAGQAILLLLKNIVIERNALYDIREWAAQCDSTLVYDGNYRDDVLELSSDAGRQDTTTSLRVAPFRHRNTFCTFCQSRKDKVRFYQSSLP